MDQQEYPFEFSVVMAVYNVEPFLREAVDSLIAQDFGFEKIQLIMVDDGSTDGSGAICDEYAEKYPENVQVIHKENGGVSSARNAGLERVQGRYVNFMDSDDKLSAETMSNVHSFFAIYKEETDVVAIPMLFFDGAMGAHIQNNRKFEKGTRVADLVEDWKIIQLSCASAFISTEAAKEMWFDEELAYCEDGKEILKLLLQKRTLGILKEAIYWYRRRTQGELSAVQKSSVNKKQYTPYLKGFTEYIIQFCIERIGYIPKFVQYTLMYHLQWQLQLEQIPDGVLTKEEINIYKSLLFSLFSFFDDDIIMAQKDIYTEHKAFILRKKYGRNPDIKWGHNDAILHYQNTYLCHLNRNQTQVEFIRINRNSIHIEGNILLIPGNCGEVQIYIEVNNEHILSATVSEMTAKKSLGEPICFRYEFSCVVPISSDIEVHKIAIFCQIGEKRVDCRRLVFGKFSPISTEYDNAYFYKNGHALTTDGEKLYLWKCGHRGRAKIELAFCRELWRKNQTGARKAVLARFVYRVLKKFKRKPIWLISDRILRADDNGEAFFRYMREAHKEIRTYFVLSKSCEDYDRLRKVGPVVNNLSWKHKMLFLLADCNISSQADAITENPFPGYEYGVKDILSQVRFIFLQHGITKDDISGWVNRYKKNFYGFVTAAEPEYQSILLGNYFYTEKEVWKTGFPRFDRLYRDEKRYITIMPTWRKYLMRTLDSETGTWTLVPQFEESDFCCFYRDLLNHPKLLSAAMQYGYKLQFLPHPTLQPHLSRFGVGKEVNVLGLDAKYREIYAQSNLVVTDYSSACFDFSYLRKPIIYCHFDSKKFFEGEHVYTKGYFDYERDGFGEVEYDLESTVDRIIEYMENGCQLKDKYRERIDKFFAFNDQNNCQRVYEKIMELDKQG